MRQPSEFSFRGFVALADLIFAVSAGLLLLNPVQFDPTPPPSPKPKPPTRPPAQTILLQLQQIETQLDKLEADSPVLQREAQEVREDE